MTPAEWDSFKSRVRLRYNRDAYFVESKEAELMKARLENVGEIEKYVGKYYSSDYVRRKVLMLTDEEIKELNKEMEKERSEGNYTPQEIT